MSGRKIQGAKRKEVIEKWLNGEDDPDWQVNPTKTDGKYIIRPRKPKTDPKPEKEEQEEPQEPEEGQEKESDDEVQHEKPKKPEKPKPKPKPAKLPKPYPGKSSKPVIPDDYAVEILAELRSIGELKRQKVTKREQKKLIKKQVRKHVPAPAKPEPDSGTDESDYDFEVGPPPPALPQRSRVCLLRH
jgi:hypothetical protein